MVVGVVVAACAAPVVDPVRNGQGRITFVDSQDLSNRQIKLRVDQWNAQAGRHQQVTYLPLPSPTDAYRAQLMARAQDLVGARGDVQAQCYDVMTLDVVWTAEFAESGYLAPLTPDEFGMDRYLSAAVASTVDERGRLWAVPWRADVGVLYYRSDVLSGKGLGWPTTWPELERMAERLGPEHGLAGYVGQLDRYEGLTVNALEAIWAHGGDADVRWDSPEVRAGIGTLVRGVEEGWIPPEALTYKESDSLKEFMEGRALFLRNWPYARVLLESSPLKGRFKMAALPGPGALGGWNVAVSRCSKHQATARKFIRFLTDEDSQRALLEQAGYPPTLRALYREPELNARLPHLGVLRTAVENARNRPRSAHYDEVTRVVQGAVHASLRNPGSLEAELRQLAADVTRAKSGR
ncbi:ABC transporter substrate-binding protein [Actinosynnema sp. NPDC047251]|uniref:ABC transporter substrate-binding protein n=1 Tax=Saccharothrix espanaensis TaxID=103731 RepID=UPI000307367C|nr:ABC transporter substrate-binding protein [Saccharothrix espanaensis]